MSTSCQSVSLRESKIVQLGTIIKEWKNCQEIKSLSENSRSTFNQMSAFFKTHNLSLNIKVKLLRCYICRVESWTLNEDTTRNLNAFEMRLNIRILKYLGQTESLTKDSLEEWRRIKDRKNSQLQYLERQNERHLTSSYLSEKNLGKYWFR